VICWSLRQAWMLPATCWWGCLLACLLHSCCVAGVVVLLGPHIGVCSCPPSPDSCWVLCILPSGSLATCGGGGRPLAAPYTSPCFLYEV
jgi:hypothetical protein